MTLYQTVLKNLGKLSGKFNDEVPMEKGYNLIRNDPRDVFRKLPNIYYEALSKNSVRLSVVHFFPKSFISDV